MGINRALSANAQRAARTNGDPSIASGFAIGKDAQGLPGMGGAWSAGLTVLAADYVWMYDDGWGGSAAATSNIVCTSAKSLGCWAHRDELLGYDPGYKPRRRPHVPQVRDGHRVRRGERFGIVRGPHRASQGRPASDEFYVGEECQTLPEGVTWWNVVKCT